MKSLFSSLLLVFAFPAISQEITVLDHTNHNPIPDVSIYSEDMMHFKTTDQNGKTDLTSFPNNSIMTFRHPSYQNLKLSKYDLLELEFKVHLKEKVIKIDEVVISANKWEQNLEEVPNEIITISPEEIAFNNAQTAADVLSNSGKVFVQKSQLGGGSPMIRGFGANSVLIVVDGVRMNNAIFRSGNLQNVVNIDPNMLEGAEVILGPGSVIYGSDALGGVMDFHTKEIEFSEHNTHFSPTAMIRYSSANQEQTGHFNWLLSNQKLGWFGGITYSQYDDLRAGNNRLENHPDFGKRNYYVKRTNGQDSIIQNDNPNIQTPSGFYQYNILQKVKWKASKNLELSFLFNMSNTGNIPRYDRLIEEEDGLPVNAEWYYGPQFWMMNALKINVRDIQIWDDARIILARQDFEESRHDRKYQRETLRHRTEKVKVYTANLDAYKSFEEYELFYGFEYAFNDVISEAYSENIESGEIFPINTRYPDGGSNTYSSAFYLSLKKDYFDEKLCLIAGGRYNFYRVNASLYREDFPFNEIESQNSSLNGNLGLTYKVSSKFRWSLLSSTGFRAPNIDDIGKIFDSEPGNVIVPNPNLKPEYSYNLESGFHWQPSESIRLEVAFYHSWLRDAMVRSDFTFNGQDSIMYDGELSNVQALVNTGKARIYGMDAQLSWEFAPNWGFESYLNITQGEDIISGEPLRHVTPVFGQTSLHFKKDRLKATFFVKYNGKIAYENLPPSERNKTHLYTEEGALSWYTLNLRTQYQLNNWLSANVSVENLLDKHYRPYSSGISAPGINVITSLRASF